MGERCFSGAFSPTRQRCERTGVWTTRLGNLVDRFVWCDEHAPSDEWRIRVEPQPAPVETAGEERKER